MRCRARCRAIPLAPADDDRPRDVAKQPAMFVGQFDQRLGLGKIGRHQRKRPLLAKFSGSQCRDGFGIARVASQVIPADPFDRENSSIAKQLRRPPNRLVAGFARMRFRGIPGERNFGKSRYIAPENQAVIRPTRLASRRLRMVAAIERILIFLPTSSGTSTRPPSSYSRDRTAAVRRSNTAARNSCN